MRWVIRSRSSSSAASISGVASSGQYKIPGTFRHGKIRLIIRVGRPASSSPLICRTLVILEGYGMTETASTTTFNPSADQRRAYSVGKPVWGTQTQVWDDQGRPLPPGPEHVGEVVTRGMHVMKGYLNRPGATAAAFTGGWLHTGDLGYVDEDGFLFIVSRKKELIIRGGYNVYPSEIENVLHAHPAVAEAAVVGVPDERLGEEVMAVVIVRAAMELGELELVTWCRERLAAYKCPRVFQFRAELPKNTLGKVLKDELAASGGVPS